LELKPFFMDELTNVTLPDGLKVIPTGCFCQSKKLSKVNLPVSLFAIMSDAFENCEELIDLVIPASLNNVYFVIHDIRDRIKNYLKSEKKDVEDVDIYEIYPNNHAFIGCSKLPLATRSKLRSWGYTSGFLKLGQ